METAGHRREESIPRMPFVTPILHSTAYREPAQQSTPEQHVLQAPKIAKQAKTIQPALNLITGFENPRTPPVPAHQFLQRPGHARKESLQERRAHAKKHERTISGNKISVTDLSPSDGTVMIGFDEALKKLNIQTHTGPFVEPVTPSIVITGIPKEGESQDDMLRKAIESHRSSFYSQVTQKPQQPLSGRHTQWFDPTPPVPAIPRDLLDSNSTLLRGSSRATSWATNFEEDDRSETYVESVPPVPAIKDDMLTLLQRSDTVATKHRSQGWWNTIITPFLRSGGLEKKMSLYPTPKTSPQVSMQPSPVPSSLSGSSHALTQENVAALSHGGTATAAATPHPADEKRDTMAFFGEATPKTAAFPSPPPLPIPNQGAIIMKSPEFEDPGAFGLAAEYFQACWHDATSQESYFACVNHDCSRHMQRGISDEKQRELFNAYLAHERAMSRAFDQDVPGPFPEISKSTKSPSLADQVDPSDSISQVAERAAPAVAAATAIAAADKALSDPAEPPHISPTRETIFSDQIGSPEVAEATAVPMVRAVSPLLTDLSREPSVKEPAARVANAAVTSLAPPSASRAVPAAGSAILPDETSRSLGRELAPPTRPPYPGSGAGVPDSAPQPPPAPASEILSHTATQRDIVEPSIGPHVQNHSNAADSMPWPEPAATTIHCQRELPVGSAPEPVAMNAAPTRNPFRRNPPPLIVAPSPEPGGDVSPAALTPGMSREAETGNAVPMRTAYSPIRTAYSPTRAAYPIDQASAGPAVEPAQPEEMSMFTRRGHLESYAQPHPMPERGVAAPFVPVEERNDAEAGHHSGEKGEDGSSEPKGKGRVAMMLARWRAKRKPKTKEEKKKRRACCCIFVGLLAMVIIIVILVLTLTLKRSDMPAQSSWLNLTSYPPLPTGIATIARPSAVLEQSGCVQPQSMWSCAVPKEQQDSIKPNAPDQPNFRIEIRFQNNTQLSNGTSLVSNGTTSKRSRLGERDSFTSGLFTPSPPPPSDADQSFLGSTTDGNAAPSDGELTPFFMSFLPVASASNGAPLLKRQDNSSADPFPNITGAIPSPAINSDGTAAAATLYPLPTAQPVRLYNRNQSTEHYGFYTYFDRSIFLSSVVLASNDSLSLVAGDLDGGSPLGAATVRCTWSQTRFLVQVWTNLPAGSAQLLNGSSTAAAAAQGNITADSQGDWAQPGSFPYPVSITLDRHGGVADDKMVYCYGLEPGTGGRVNATLKQVVSEFRGFGGNLVDPAGGLFNNNNDTSSDAGGGGGGGAAGGIDGGTGGCGCVWQNWQKTGGS